jgi:hypothetical protein
LLYKIKLKVSWHISGKNCGVYNSYEEYKNSWGSDTVLGKIKSDFRKSRLSNNVSSDNRDMNNLMNDIRETRIRRDIIKQKIRNSVNMRRK